MDWPSGIMDRPSFTILLCLLSNARWFYLPKEESAWTVNGINKLMKLKLTVKVILCDIDKYHENIQDLKRPTRLLSATKLTPRIIEKLADNNISWQLAFILTFRYFILISTVNTCINYSLLFSTGWLIIWLSRTILSLSASIKSEP